MKKYFIQDPEASDAVENNNHNSIYYREAIYSRDHTG
jgi:hypothetical protein